MVIVARTGQGLTQPLDWLSPVPLQNPLPPSQILVSLQNSLPLQIPTAFSLRVLLSPSASLASS